MLFTKDNICIFGKTNIRNSFEKNTNVLKKIQNNNEAT